MNNISRRSMLKFGAIGATSLAVPKAFSGIYHPLNNNSSPMANEDIDTVAKLATDECIKAFCNGSFSVGGVLIDITTGDIIHSLHNLVVQNGTLLDPTAHGERQLVDWYFQSLKDGVQLPPVENLAVVSSLDPCAMCNVHWLSSFCWI